MGKRFNRIAERYGRVVHGDQVYDAIDRTERELVYGTLTYSTLNELEAGRDNPEAGKAGGTGDLAPLSSRQMMTRDGKAACEEIRFVPLSQNAWEETDGGRIPEMPSAEDLEIDERQKQFQRLFDEVSAELQYAPHEVALIAANVLDLPVLEVGENNLHIRVVIPGHAFIDYPVQIND